MTRLTAEEIAELRALRASTTGSSWTARPSRFKAATVVFTDANDHVAYFGHAELGRLGEEDAEFCVAAHEHMPALLAHVAALEADIAARDEAIRMLRATLAEIATGEMVGADSGHVAHLALAAADRALGGGT